MARAGKEDRVFTGHPYMISLICLPQGLDFLSLIKSNRLAYISGLGDVADGVNTLDLATQNSTSLLARLQETVTRQITPTEDSATSATRPVLVIDGLDFLLDSLPSLSVLQVSQLVLSLRQHMHSMVVTASADFPLLHNSSVSATPMEKSHRAFVTSLAHQSRQVIQTRALGTGAAEDITGVLRVSTGGDLGEELEGLEEGEWLYKVKGDGNARVWARGE